jgi:hypothetical protein
MKQIRVYQTKDGQTFNDRITAETHELMIKIRGIIQNHVKGEQFSPTEMAKIMVANQTEVFDIIGKYRRTVASVKGAQTKQN